MIRTTLAASPRRGRVLMAKAIVIGCVTFAAGLAAVAVAFPIIQRILRANGFTPPVYPVLSLTVGTALRVVAGSVLYLALIALLSLGAASAVRDSATAIAVVLGLLYLVPVFAQVIGDPHWRRHLLQIGPMTAGLAIQATANLRNLPIGSWPGIGVLAAWAAAALLAGGLLLRLRDA